jgi:hypothetical protein
MREVLIISCVVGQFGSVFTFVTLVEHLIFVYRRYT